MPDRDASEQVIAIAGMRSIDHRPVCANRVRKSVGAENTFPRDLSSFDEMKVELEPLVDKVWRYCESTGVRGAP